MHAMHRGQQCAASVDIRISVRKTRNAKDNPFWGIVLQNPLYGLVTPYNM